MAIFSNITEFFSIHNYQRLVHALRTESPKQVWQNLLRYVTGKSRPVIQRAPGLLFCCEYAIIIREKLVVGGWAGAEEGIKELKILCNQQELGAAKFCVNRSDIQQQYPQLAEGLQSGFAFELEEIEQVGIAKNSVQKIDFQIIKNTQETIDFSVKLMKLRDVVRFLGPVRLDLNELYQIYIEKESTIETWQKVFKKSNITEPIGIVLLPNFEQQVGNLDNHLKELEDQIQSIQDQINPHWQLYLPIPTNRKEINDFVVRYKGNEKITLINYANKTELNLQVNALTKEQYLLLVENNVLLRPNSLIEFAEHSKEQNHHAFYCDHDFISTANKRINPHFKSNYNPAQLLSENYIGNLLLVQKKLLTSNNIQVFNEEHTRGAEIYDLLLRLYHIKKSVHRIPSILYHQKIEHVGETENKGTEAALKRFVENNNWFDKVEAGLAPNTYRLRPKMAEEEPICIIIPFKDDVETLKTCVESIFEKTAYSNYHLFLVSNNSQEKATFDYLNWLSNEKNNVQWKAYDVPFNYAAINNWAVKECQKAQPSELILLLNNDTEAIEQGWLQAMVEQLQFDGVGAVGAKLLYPDDTVQHAGVILGYHGLADHAFSSFDRTENGYLNRINVIQDYSACTAACLLMRRNLFEEIGGFDEENLKVNFNDVDLCLEIIKSGRRVVYTPFAQLYHYESKSRGDNTSTPEKRKREVEEIRFFKSKWKEYIEQGDPFYNPNLTLDKTDFSLNIKYL